nr:HAD-IIB family hydrolase [uncultured Haemophilus sp.]
MNTSPHTFVFDIDGTISQNGLPVSAEIAHQLERLAQTHQVIFTSARPIRDMLPMLPQSLHQSAIFMGCNGGMAYQNGDFLFVNALPTDAVERIINALNTHQIPYVLDGKWGYSLSEIYHPFHDYIDTLSKAKMPEAALIKEGITKILVLSNHQKTVLLSLVDTQFSVHQHKQEDIFDITPPNNNKYATLQKLVGKQPYIAFGNDENDFLMLRHAEQSIFLEDKADFENADFYLNIANMAMFLERYA